MSGMEQPVLKHPANIEETFRHCMRVTAASVSLLTCRDEDETFRGMAVSSFTSLSMDPPAMLVAVNRNASSYQTIVRTKLFCINLLSETQIALVEKYCRSDNRETRFGNDEWSAGHCGLPYLRDALANIFCHVESQHDHGTHTVFFGGVQTANVNMDDERMPLVWVNGGPARIFDHEAVLAGRVG